MTRPTIDDKVLFAYFSRSSDENIIGVYDENRRQIRNIKRNNNSLEDGQMYYVIMGGIDINDRRHELFGVFDAMRSRIDIRGTFDEKGMPVCNGVVRDDKHNKKRVIYCTPYKVPINYL